MTACFASGRLRWRGVSADWLADRLKDPAKAWLDRIGGSFLIVAAVLLGLKSLRDA